MEKTFGAVKHFNNIHIELWYSQHLDAYMVAYIKRQVPNMRANLHLKPEETYCGEALDVFQSKTYSVAFAQAYRIFKRNLNNKQLKRKKVLVTFQNTAEILLENG